MSVELWILTTTISAFLLALVALACERVFAPRPAVRHALWLLVLVKLCVPPLVSWPALVLPAEPAPILTRPSALPATAVVPPGTALRTSFAARPSTPGAAEPNTAEPNTGARASGAGLELPATRSLVLLLWGLGAAIALGVHGRRILRLQRAANTAAPAPPWLAEEVAELARSVGVRAPRTRLHGGDTSPFVTSLGRPLLMLPAGWLARWSRERRQSVIVHELAHLARRDHWTGWLELLVAVVHWWNPLVLLVRRRLYENAELACDARVVALLPTARRSYAETLLDVGAGFLRSVPEPRSALAFGMAPRDLRAFERRLTMVMNANAPARLPLAAKAGIAALVVVALPAFSVAHAVQDRRPVETQDDEKQKHQDSRWTAELTHEERLADGFESLNITTSVGSIRISPSGGDTLRVEATVRADDDVPAALKTEVFADHVEVSAQGGTLEIHDKHQDRKGDDESRSKQDYQGWNVSLRIYLPRPLAVKASSGVGSITVDTAMGDVSLNSGVGTVTMKLPDAKLGSVSAGSGAGSVRLELGGVDGKLSASSGAGDVAVSLKGAASGGASISSGAGSLDVTLPGSISGSFDIETSAGSVKVDAALGIEVDRGYAGAKARGSVGGGGPEYKIHTGAGSIKVKTGGEQTKSPDRVG